MDNDNSTNRMKLAVAMAILRNKPEGTSGPQYAKQLADRLNASQLHWKRRCREAETEILHLRQQLLIQKTSAGSQSALQDSQPTASLPPDSQPLFPSPPPSGSADVKSTLIPSQTSLTPSDGGSSLAQHTEFLHHVINIQTGCQVFPIQGGHSEDVIKDSLIHSLYLLQKHMGSEEYSWKVQRHCVQCIVRLLEKSPDDFVKTLLNKVTDLCMQICNRIIFSQDASLQQTRVKDHLVDLLVEFSSSRHVTATLLINLCECIFLYSNELRKVQQNEEALDALKFCNMYHIMKACERCLTSKGGRDMDSKVKGKMLTLLEDSLLHLAGSYPLFAHGIWKLCSFL